MNKSFSPIADDSEAETEFPLLVKAVMIDLDGTLLDTARDLATAANMMLRELGRAELPLETIQSYIGKGVEKLVKRSLTGSIDGEPDAELLGRAMPIYERDYAETLCNDTQPYPDVLKGLNVLRENGFGLACVTNKAEAFTGIQPRQMLLIGDSLNDAQAARAAGCRIFCVPYGYNEGRDVHELDCDAVVSSLYEATKLIQKLP